MSLRSTPAVRRFLGVLFGIPVAFSILFFIANTMAQHLDGTRITLEQLSFQVAELRAIANDAEVGEQGYLLTGDQRYRETFASAERRLERQLKSGAKAIPARFRGPFDHCEHLAERRVQLARKAIDVAAQSGTDAGLEVARTDNSETIMAELRELVRNLHGRISAENGQVGAHYYQLASWGFILFLLGTLIMLVVMIWLYNNFLGYMAERDAANVRLQNLNRELEQRIAERTKELQEFNDELQQFAYVASHDLQEPLRTITSFSQLLAGRYRGKFDGDADEFLDYIVNSARRMSDLLSGLLTLVRLRKAGQPMNEVDLRELIEAATGNLQAAIRESAAEVEVGPMPTLSVEKVQFTQVFQNLIANAIKYRSQAAPHIRIEARRDGTQWLLSVRDNGQGFDPQFAERIFGLFQRLRGRDVDGTGMGLAIVKRIVERHGGRIWAESAEGEGSTFYISLPTSLEFIRITSS